jgi:hypothetical protein
MHTAPATIIRTSEVAIFGCILSNGQDDDRRPGRDRSGAGEVRQARIDEGSFPPVN